LRLASSPLGRLVILVPAFGRIAARVSGGEPVALAEGVTSIQAYTISLRRGTGAVLPELARNPNEISQRLAARLRALGYAH
jgi:hypothetical protein